MELLCLYFVLVSVPIVHCLQKVMSASVDIAVVTYSGDRSKLFSMLIPSFQRFVNPVEFTYTVILDEEKPTDHELGKELEVNYGFKAKYNVMEPWSPVLSVSPFYGLHNRYSMDGYTRQLYITFFFDQYSDGDIIGIVDSDVQFTSYMAKANMFTADGKIIVHGWTKEDFPNYEYVNDPFALQANVPFYNMMASNYMPQFLFRSTFENCRKHIMTAHNVGTFEEAWLIIGRNKISPANVLLNYALIYEPHRYQIIESKDKASFPVVGWNLPYNAAIHKAGCCRAYNVSCTDELRRDVRHVVAPTNDPAQKLFTPEHIDNTTKSVDEFYARLVHHIQHLKQHNSTVLEKMKNACMVK